MTVNSNTGQNIVLHHLVLAVLLLIDRISIEFSWKTIYEEILHEEYCDSRNKKDHWWKEEERIKEDKRDTVKIFRLWTN